VVLLGLHCFDIVERHLFACCQSEDVATQVSESKRFASRWLVLRLFQYKQYDVPVTKALKLN